MVMWYVIYGFDNKIDFSLKEMRRWWATQVKLVE